MMNDSLKLLADYVETGSESAFRELVARYVNLVYATAVRLVGGDTHLAEDVAQTVFIDLAGKARALSREVMLGGWLHRHTCFVAAKLLRSDRRRRDRERQAAEMNALHDHSEDNLAQIAPVLDEAINQLPTADRTAILLRFFEQRDLRTVGNVMGRNEDAARMRVHRALAKLHGLLKRRGATLTAAALGTTLAGEAVTAAPAGLALTISNAALASAAAGAGSTITLFKFMAMAKLKIGIIGALVIAGVATPFWVQHQAQLKLQEQAESLRQTQDHLAELQAENQTLSNRIALTQATPPPENDEHLQLLRLRSEVTRLRGNTQELAQLKAERAHPSTPLPTAMTNILASGLDTAKNFMEDRVLVEVARMKERLGLSPQQEQAIKEIMLRRVETRSQATMQALTGKLTDQQASQLHEAGANEEAQIKALLTPEQLAAYPEFKQEESAASARDAATNELKLMQDSLNLSEEQQNQVYPILYGLQMDALSNTPGVPGQQSLEGRDLTNVIEQQQARQRQELDQKLQALTGILTPEQLEAYHQQQTARLDRMGAMMKALVPQKDAGASR